MKTLTRKTAVSEDVIIGILKRCGIASCEVEACLALALYGVRPSFAPSIRRGKRGRAFNAILTELSKGLSHKFPPPDYVPPCDYEDCVASGARRVCVA